MEELYDFQQDLFETLKRSELNFRKSPKERIKKAYVEARLENLEQLWRDFKDGHKHLIYKASKEDKSDDYFTSEMYEKFEDLYLQYKTNLKEAVQPPTTEMPSAPAQLSSPSVCMEKSVNEVKLPVITLPTFSGRYEEWQSFADLFVTLIHENKRLTAVQKLHYLKTNLKGEPERLLSNYQITDSNYTEAWAQLVKRYDNKRFTCNAILKILYNQKSINVESATAIRQLVDTTTTCLKSLENTGIEIRTWDPFINYLIISKLDCESIKQWEQSLCKGDNELPTWYQLKEFLEARFRSLEMIESSKARAVISTKSKPNVFHASIEKGDNISELKCCALCSDNHHIFNCKKFSEMTVKDRQDFVKTKRLCFNCFSPTHVVSRCRRKYTRCKRCGKLHHSLLHIERDESEQKNEKLIDSKPTVTGRPSEMNGGKPNTLSNFNETYISSNFSKEHVTNNVLLATANVFVRSSNGYRRIVRVLLDQGSQASFVTESTVQFLSLPRKPVSGWVSGVGEGQMRIKHMVSLVVESRHDPKATVSVNAYVLRSLTTLLPTTDLSAPKWSDLESLELADPGYATPGRIDILLGAEVYSDILLDGILKHPQENLLAQNTILGWVLSGKMSSESTSARRKFTNLHVQVKEDEMLKQFWELENEPNSIDRKLSKEEERCENYYDATTMRDKEGRYIVKLPFKDEDPVCHYGNTCELAGKRLEFLERKLSRDKKLKEEYTRVMDEYINLNHMIEVDLERINNPKSVYLPHHAVLREDKTTSKLRVVFDASCKDSINGISLNDCLLVGPKLQQDLRHILMRWRMHKICIAADIVKMYRMIRVAEEDTEYQRVLWRSSPDKPITHFRLLRLTFGTACAPYLAVKTLQRLANDEQLKYPRASKIAKNDFYMDDLLTGCESIEEAKTIYNDMNKLMSLGGFELQKWTSNYDKLLCYIGKNTSDNDSLQIKANKSLIKILGVSWNRGTDIFEYTLNLSAVKQPITKRQILSDVAKLYDPLGWLAPVVVLAKILIQKLWKTRLQWDETVTGDLLVEWLTYREKLNNIKHISIPRWLHYSQKTKVELHAFADASKVAYGTAMYIRVIEEDQIYTTLVSAKTKVAPIEKEVSIPRLELCGAVLASKLLSEISQVMKVPKENLYAWSDSKIVLAWLKAGPGRWNTFISNRVSDILNILDYEQWGHVSTDTNPADYASRGLYATDLVDKELWWKGPKWLLTLDTTRHVSFVVEDTHEEEKVTSLITLSQTEEDFIWNKYSSLSKMLRIISYCRRFLNLKLSKEKRDTFSKIVTPREMMATMDTCIKRVQAIAFHGEIKLLTSQGCVPKGSHLRNLCPILDNNGILRVGGRIQNAQVHYDIRHPIILPAKSHLSKLIITDAHQRTMHGGPQAMLNFLRTRYWILRAKDQVKKIYHGCVTCIRYSKRNTTQLMGQLPEPRLKPGKPFKTAGVDYAGPINIRFSPGKGSKSYKGYICLFVCFVTRAIHLEAVTDMTTKGFLQAFRRFTARKGHCQNIYSDNGTNLVGASRQLKEMFNNAKSSFPSEIAELLAQDHTTWHFMPPHSPNFGGLWEAGVRSTKSHLLKVIGDSTLTYEELSTVLAQIEACLNSRPLTVLSDDPDDPLPLTPGHFLVGEPLIHIPDEDYTQTKILHLDRWRLTQKMVANFWNRWYKEYLVSLSHRYKWNTKTPDPEIDDIVILKEDNMPPCKWLLGRIIQKYVGPDNMTRVVKVKCKNGVYKRPVSKICKILIQEPD